MLETGGQQPDRTPEQDVPEAAPVLFIVIDQESGAGVGPKVADPAQAFRGDALRLGIDRRVDVVAPQHEGDRDQPRLTALRGREMADPHSGDPVP
jgi:hypothetical protein